MKTYCVKTVAKIDHLIVFIHLIFVIILQKKKVDYVMNQSLSLFRPNLLK